MAENTDQIREAVLQAFRDLEMQRAPKQNILQIYSGIVGTNGYLSLPTAGEEMTLAMWGTGGAIAYLMFAKTKTPPRMLNAGNAEVYYSGIRMRVTSATLTTVTLPVRSEYITIFAEVSMVEFVAIFSTRNMGVRIS